MAKALELHCGTIVLAIGNPLVRRAMTDEFRHRGVGEIRVPADLKSLSETVTAETIDILVLDDLLVELPTGSLIRDIRYGVIHAHPFPLVVALAHQQTEPDLRALIDCGPDAVVLVPVSIADLFSKIERLAAGRKPFIVTRNYVGPDRRDSLRPGAQPPRYVEAPNPLAGNTDPDIYKNAINKGAEAVKSAKMECSLDQLAYALKAGNPAAFKELIPSLENLARSTSKQPLREAANDLSAAINTQVLDTIMQSSRKLLAAAQARA